MFKKCNHFWIFHRKTSGDENNYSLPKRNIFKCYKCGKYKNFY